MPTRDLLGVVLLGGVFASACATSTRPDHNKLDTPTPTPTPAPAPALALAPKGFHAESALFGQGKPTPVDIEGALADARAGRAHPLGAVA